MADFVCFLIPFLFWFQFRMIGVLPGGEFLTLALVIPCLLGAWKRVWRGYNKPIFIMMGVWLLAQIISDFYNHSPFENMAKGEALIAFFVIDLIVLSALIQNNERRILFFALGTLIGRVISIALMGRENATWKFEYSPLTTLAVLLLSCFFYSRQRYRVVAFLTLILAAVNLSQDYRSQAMISLLAGVVAFPVSVLTRQQRHKSNLHHSKARTTFVPASAFNAQTVIVLVSIAIAGFGVSKAYSYLASTGELGDEAQHKYEMQSRGKLGLLVGGRPETFIALMAIRDSPILGHGSWAEDPKYAEMLSDLQSETGYAEEVDHSSSDIDNYLIPSHSHLMGAWVFSGIFGAAFWLYIYYLVIKAVLWIVRYHPRLAPYYSYLMVNEMWDILFSPFGQNRRLETAFLLVVICTLFESTSRSLASKSAQPRSAPGNFVGMGRAVPRFQ